MDVDSGWKIDIHVSAIIEPLISNLDRWKLPFFCCALFYISDSLIRTISYSIHNICSTKYTWYETNVTRFVRVDPLRYLHVVANSTCMSFRQCSVTFVWDQFTNLFISFHFNCIDKYIFRISLIQKDLLSYEIFKNFSEYSTYSNRQLIPCAHNGIFTLYEIVIYKLDVVWIITGCDGNEPMTKFLAVSFTCFHIFFSLSLSFRSFYFHSNYDPIVQIGDIFPYWNKLQMKRIESNSFPFPFPFSFHFELTRRVFVLYMIRCTAHISLDNRG